jgi:hypothetical protein
MESRLSNPGELQEGQGALFDDEPKPNSPEDLGLVTPPHVFGEKTPEPRKTTNASSHALKLPEIRKFVEWIHKQGLPTHADVTVGHVFVALSGMSMTDLRWLCKAIRRAGRAPRPSTMLKAAKARDVRILRPGGDPETVGRRSG